VAGARTRAAEKGSGDDLQTPEFAVRSSVGASGSLLKALRRKELAAIREAKNARAVEGVVVGLRRFSPNDDGPFGRITLRPYTRDRTLTTKQRSTQRVGGQGPSILHPCSSVRDRERRVWP